MPLPCNFILLPGNHWVRSKTAFHFPVIPSINFILNSQRLIEITAFNDSLDRANFFRLKKISFISQNGIENQRKEKNKFFFVKVCLDTICYVGIKNFFVYNTVSSKKLSRKKYSSLPVYFVTKRTNVPAFSEMVYSFDQY